MAAACSRFGPQLHIDIDNVVGPDAVTVTVDSSGPGMPDVEDVHVAAGQVAGWRVPLASTWEVKVDGRHVIGSGDRAVLALPSPGQRHDLMITIRIGSDGTVELLEACFDDDYVAGRCAAQ